jgi:hypothetical protein
MIKLVLSLARHPNNKDTEAVDAASTAHSRTLKLEAMEEDE